MKDLTKVDKITIESKANELLNSHNIDSYNGVNLIDLAKDMGFVVGTTYLDDSEDGFIIVDDDSHELVEQFGASKVIVVNERRSYKEKLFIIAHEIGHFVLNEHKSKIFAHRERRPIVRGEEENDIDFFAACLLMPKVPFKKKLDALKEMYGNDTKKIITELSDIFGVTPITAERRIAEVKSN